MCKTMGVQIVVASLSLLATHLRCARPRGEKEQAVKPSQRGLCSPLSSEMASLLYSLLRWCCLNEQYSRRAEYIGGHCSVNELGMVELPIFLTAPYFEKAAEPG